MELADEIRKIAEGKLTNDAHFVVDVVISVRGTQKVVVIVDGDHGVTIDDCAELSRELSKDLEDLAALKDSYLLEVTTPGLDQPLRMTRQYSKNVGRNLRVKLKDAIVEGKLTTVTSEGIALDVTLGEGKKKEVKSVDIKFSEIDKSFVLVSFK